MLDVKQRTFLKRSRKGKVIKVVREHYLRKDIPCGSRQCSACHSSSYIVPRLDIEPTSRSNFISRAHYIVLDTNIILNQINVLECDGLENVIIFKTVLDEVRHRSAPIYKRLRDIICDKRRKFYVFENEHHHETYIDDDQRCSLGGETVNDRNDRAIRVACVWYKKHLLDIDIVLVSDDIGNLTAAKKLDIPSVSFVEYINGMVDFPELADKISAKEDSNKLSFNQKFLFREHLSPSQISAGCKSGKLFRGIFYTSRTNYMEGTVNNDDLGYPILIQGLENQNRAVNGDCVAVELFNESEWSAPSEIVLEDDCPFDNGDSIEGERAQIDQSIKSSNLQPTGHIVGIVRRNWKNYCGILNANPIKNSIRHIFIPSDKAIPKVRIETRQAEKMAGQRIVVTIDCWPRYSRYPLGHFVRLLGPIGDKSTENQVLLLEHDIPFYNFSDSVLECLPKMPWTISPEEELKRLDLRQIPICSVDPPGCTDIDDALHCRFLPNGNYEVGVHIADVSYFIQPGSAIDKEAANRGTTVYLTDRRIDMVPELLSSNLCSLRGGEERLAFSCIWEMTTDAQIVSTRFQKSIICSKAALTYAQAQTLIDDRSKIDDVSIGLRHLLELSKIMKKRRVDKGALLLASSEVKFCMDSETADPIGVENKEILETNSMVEEFMLAANISAAEAIYREFPECAMLRRHPAPPFSNFDPLVKAGQQRSFKIVVDSGKALADSLDAAVDPSQPFFNTMLRMIATRCMMQAVYFASGTLEEPMFAHYGLACPIYTHFTSPIRRYADIIVHRLLAVTIGAGVTYKELLDKKAIQSVAVNINYRHRMAQYASRSSVNLHTHLFFRNRVRDEDGYVLFIRQNALQILIPRYGLEGTLYIRSASDSKSDFKFDEDKHTQSCAGVTICLFQKVVVQMSLDSSNVQREKLVLRLVLPHIPGFSVPSTFEDS